MKRYRINEFKQGFGFLEIILVMAVILFLSYRLLNQYFKKPLVDKETQELLSSQGIDTSSYKATTDSVRQKIQDITQQHLKQLDDIK
jgi:uncharacterized membrane protein YhiD involved in acid resistance